MARTVVGVNDPKAVKRWSGALAFDVSAQSFFNRKFMGAGSESSTPIQVHTDLASDAGEVINYDLVAELRMEPVEGEDILENKEENQRFYTDQIYIDQARVGANTGGRMTRKRTLHDLRAIAKRQQAAWWARLHDELLFIYLSGIRGVNSNFIVRQGYTGRANNALRAPDAEHQLFGGDATATSNIDSTDKMTLGLLDRAVTRAAMQGGGADNVATMQPCKIAGEEYFVCVLSPLQENALRTDAGTGGWLDIQKAAAAADGKNSPLFKGGLGMYRNTVLHSHRNVIRFKGGAGSAVDCARGLFMGVQAGVVAYGSPGTSLRYDWYEEARDNGDKVVISSSSIFGTKKVAFTMEDGTTKDFGVMALDTAAATV
ncbi:N4-gp56 family major capsid protein [Uliginosibacterium sp. 31-12]|uniref:N4-gp56 family major capsid protein n=1 Tax=Uliginosibacterium sp. 31-12 TaxID=3062781 RepID=UPI0026E292FE|nr:N4-gp56 family major capsid protein [Uliginosibacterium sp. 31-12]MDO6385585.1 N4-gp56 family major capsid protein [Uliginosibacterium sp. 31-12]